jgi:uncharacterized membrane protein
LTNSKYSVRWLVECSFLLALEISFLCVPIFQIDLGPFSIVFSALPITIASIFLGIRTSLVLGIAWGAISFFQCFGDAFGLIMLQANPFNTFIVCCLSRVIVGLLTILVFTSFNRTKLPESIKIGVTCLFSSLINNVLFFGLLFVLFRKTFLEIILPILSASIVFNMLPEAIVNVALGIPIAVALRKSKLVEKYL